jgi:hypothetical protein
VSGLGDVVGGWPEDAAKLAVEPEVAGKTLDQSLEEIAEKRRAARALESFAPPRKPKGKKLTLTDSEWKDAKRRAHEWMTKGDWTDAWPRDFVAAYALLHNQVYGVEPSELTPEVRYRICAVVQNFLKREFHDDKNLFAEFMRWTWDREEGREKWRRENQRSGGRIAWQTQFMPSSILSDWRIDHVRRGHR